jgi:hypothetical protein
MAFWSALRRWGERAVAAGVLTIADIRNGAPAACTLLPGAISPSPINPPEKPTLVAPAERPDEVGELLDDFLIALFDLPGDAWSDIALALPDGLFDRIDRYLYTLLS